ncbi:sigma-70 family RNA polymerase sigma factor [Nocardia wallacei]|uniref:sigma-70 family RNA polymerase sigma factor n=1 Tax=Nocardia wallacei TaxID=480035 RepID=UPI0024541009|nr:sigma-70 family RNA polymerase sigma factor [Nocardia wallacei]
MPADSKSTDRGDPALEEFEAFYRTHFELVRRVLTTMLRGDRTQVPDLHHEVMIRVWKHWKTVRRVDEPEPYLSAMCRTVVIDYWRATQKNPVPLPDHVLLHLLDEEAQARKTLGVDDIVVGNELTANVLQAIPLGQREALSRAMDGHTGATMAEGLQLGVAAAAKQLNRARASARDEVEGMKAAVEEDSADPPPLGYFESLVSMLSENEWRVAVLSWGTENLRPSQIAALLDMPVSRVNLLKSRARKKLRHVVRPIA